MGLNLNIQMKYLILKITAMFLILFPSLFKGQPSSSIHQFTANTIEGNTLNFKEFKGKKLLIVNTASKCGLTPQFKELQNLFEKYKSQNFMIVGFPSNDFAKQDPGSNNEIKSFCERNYGVSFLMMEKISVKGDSIHPIYKWLTQKSENGVINSKVKWNFQKYLIDENGHLAEVMSPRVVPNDSSIINWIEGK